MLTSTVPLLSASLVTVAGVLTTVPGSSVTISGFTLPPAADKLRLGFPKAASRQRRYRYFGRTGYIRIVICSNHFENKLEGTPGFSRNDNLVRLSGLRTYCQEAP